MSCCASPFSNQAPPQRGQWSSTTADVAVPICAFSICTPMQTGQGSRASNDGAEGRVRPGSVTEQPFRAVLAFDVPRLMEGVNQYAVVGDFEIGDLACDQLVERAFRLVA